MTQPLGKARGECFYLASTSPFALISPALTTLEQSDLVHDNADYFYICSMCFSPDGRYLATGADEGEIRVRGSPCRSLTNHLPLPTFDSVLSPQHAFPHLHIYHAQPEYLFAPHHPQIWDIATKHILSRFEGHKNRVISLSFSRDGRLIISGSWDNTVRIWDKETKQHETMSIRAQGDVRVIVTYHRVWHANACCVYGRR
jgi:WD40 repeat protein